MDGLYKRALEEGYQNYVKSGENWFEDYNDGGVVMKWSSFILMNTEEWLRKCCRLLEQLEAGALNKNDPQQGFLRSRLFYFFTFYSGS